MSGWELSVEERRRAVWERRGLVEEGGQLTATCRVCWFKEEAGLMTHLDELDVRNAVSILLHLGWGFEERDGRPWLWSCPDH